MKTGHLQRIADFQRQLLDFDYMCSGTLLRRSLACGKDNCRCKANPPALHGPYYYWSRRHGGRLLQKVLSSGQARLVARAIQNYRKALKLLRRWETETVLILERQKLNS